MISARRSHATPSARRQLVIRLEAAAAGIRRLRHHILVDVAVAACVLALPLSLGGSAASHAVAELAPVAAVMSTELELPRALPVGRGSTIAPVSDPTTVVADDVRPIVHYTLGPADDLETLANFFHVSAEAIAYSNGITDASLANQGGREILIPPGQGALYTVKDGDTVASVATQFKVDTKAIETYNRLYFEPEHFAAGQLIFVPGASVPALAKPSEPEAPAPAPAIARAGPVAPANTGRLAWPVAGVITQYFWAYHTGVDLAAPYGTGVGASDAGVVVYEGWVAVGGLSVRIQHANGMETGYYHLSATNVGVGQRVERGQIIGAIGMTGVTTGPHVHWELKLNGRFVNPLAY